MEEDPLKLKDEVKIHRTCSQDTVVMEDQEDFEEEEPVSLFRESQEMCPEDVYDDFNESDHEEGDPFEGYDSDEFIIELPDDITFDDLDDYRGIKRRLSGGAEEVEQLSAIFGEFPAKVIKLEK